MRPFTLFLLSLVCLIALSSCSSSGAGKKDLSSLGNLSESELAALQEQRYGEGSIPRAEAEGLFRDVYFSFDSSIVDDRARQDIEHNLQVLRDYPKLKIVLEGHCDERGTAEYNLILGEERGRAVEKVLLSYGLERSRLQIISYGEELPVEPSQNEFAYARNRRVHFAPGSSR